MRRLRPVEEGRGSMPAAACKLPLHANASAQAASPTSMATAPASRLAATVARSCEGSERWPNARRARRRPTALRGLPRPPRWLGFLPMLIALPVWAFQLLAP